MKYLLKRKQVFFSTPFRLGPLLLFANSEVFLTNATLCFGKDLPVDIFFLFLVSANLINMDPISITTLKRQTFPLGS